MGAFGIWQWLIVFLAIFVMFGLPVLAIWKENSEQRLGRLKFFYWILAIVVVPFFIRVVGGIFEAEVVPNLLAFIFLIAIIYPVYQRVVRRARDVGMGKMIAYLSVIPLVNIVTTLILLLKPSGGEARGGE